MDKLRPIRPQIKATDKALEKAAFAVVDLAADALAVDPNFTARLGSVGKKLKEAHEEWDKILADYL